MTERIAPYLALMKSHPAWFAGPADGVVIARDPDEISRIEAEVAARYGARGTPPAWAEVGIRFQDPYVILLVDAVTFPDGGVGVHHRVMRLAETDSGVAVLPLLDGEIVLIRHFRHPIRDWSWEIPRGAIEVGATPEETVRAELLEEIQAPVEILRPLGRMYGATGFMGLGVQLYVATISSTGRPALDEGIGQVRTVAVAEFEAMVVKGEILDSFTLGAFLHARLIGLI